MSDERKTRKKPRKTPAAAEAPAIDPKTAASLVADAVFSDAVSSLLAEYVADPERLKAALDNYREVFEGGERLRAEVAKAGLELPQRSRRPVGMPSPPVGNIRSILAVNLRIWMAQRNINQRELSDLAGVSQRHISQIMNCTTGVTIDVVETLARALNTSPADLLTYRPGLL